MGNNQKTELGRALVRKHNQMVQQTMEKCRFYRKKFLESFAELSDIDAIIEQTDEPELNLHPRRSHLRINLDPCSGSGSNDLTAEEARKQQKIEGLGYSFQFQAWPRFYYRFYRVVQKIKGYGC